MPSTQYARLDRATAGLDGPVAVVDLDAFDANAADLVRRAGGTPLRVASKSVRCRALLRRVLAVPGFAGVLAFTVAEALWLAEEWDDVVVGYPSAERRALARLAADPVAASRVAVMVDGAEGLDLVRAAVAEVADAAPLRVCLDLDASLRIAGGRVHVGPRRSPVHSVGEAVALARLVVDDPRFRLVGLMAYEGQVAGVPDRPLGKPLQVPVLRRLKRASVAELTERRGAVVAAVRRLADLEFVNGGGTGSVETTAADPSVTEVAAGSGLYAPTLFDRYDGFTPAPAALFGLDVVRRPAPGIVTVAGGGWIASGPPGPDRVPVPTYPEGLRLIGTEGAGEVQTPLHGAAADGLRLGDRVWFRHAKAGELCERVDALHLMAGEQVVESVPTYRGEGRTFL
ncbi:amino acid deaminase/aldolase [Nocardioides sp. KR10-350]|uniref:amino acid deaminase/aldolase n=1 Tax=Nocardioides cheoyonin TaxID=3156615 RepID=UPI0032B40080